MENKLEKLDPKTTNIFTLIEALKTKKGVNPEYAVAYLLGMFDAHASQETKKKIVNRINEMENN